MVFYHLYSLDRYPPHPRMQSQWQWPQGSPLPCFLQIGRKKRPSKCHCPRCRTTEPDFIPFFVRFFEKPRECLVYRTYNHMYIHIKAYVINVFFIGYGVLNMQLPQHCKHCKIFGIGQGLVHFLIVEMHQARRESPKGSSIVRESAPQNGPDSGSGFLINCPDF